MVCEGSGGLFWVWIHPIRSTLALPSHLASEGPTGRGRRQCKIDVSAPPPPAPLPWNDAFLGPSFLLGFCRRHTAILVESLSVPEVPTATAWPPWGRKRAEF